MSHVQNKSKGVLGSGDSAQLWDEVVAQIPAAVLLNKNVKILNVACGHAEETKALIRRMRDLGLPNTRIRNAIWLNDKYSTFTNYWLRQGFQIIEGDFLKHDFRWDLNMRFDVVIGNPPFQDSSAKSSKKLWPKFVETSFELLNEGGYMAMITPSSWMAGKSPVFDVVVKNNCLYLDEQAEKYFSGVGSTFSVYVVQKAKYEGQTRQPSNKIINLALRTFLPRCLDTEVLSVIDKFAGSKLGVHRDSFCHTQRKTRVSNEKSKKFVHPNKHGAETVVWSNVPHPCMKKKKVMFYMSGRPKPFFDNGKHGISQHHGYVEVRSKKEADSVISFLESKIVQFVLRQTTFAQAWNGSYLDSMPGVSFSCTWTDKELYKHFKLTKKEIEYIENAIK